MTQEDLATDDVMILDTWDQVTLNSLFTRDSNKQIAPVILFYLVDNWNLHKQLLII